MFLASAPIRRLTNFVGADLFANEDSNSSLPDFYTELHETESVPTNHTNNACGASVILGSHPETEKDVNQVKASAHLNPPVSECINKDALNTSTDHDPKRNDVSKDEGNLAPEVNPVANLSKKDVSEKTTKGKKSGKRQRVSVTAANKASTVILVAVHNPILKVLLSECYSLYFILFSPTLIIEGCRGISSGFCARYYQNQSSRKYLPWESKNICCYST